MNGTTVSVAFPLDLFEEISRIAVAENWSLAKSVVFLARLGAKAQKAAEHSLNSSHEVFMTESDAAIKKSLGDDLMCSIFDR